MTTVAFGLRRFSSGTTTRSRSARKTGVLVAASTLMAATIPSFERAPKTVSRRQPPNGTAPGALAPGRAGVHTYHLGGHSALVDEDKAVGADRVYPFAVAIALGRDLGAIPFGRPKRLFLRVSFRFLSARHNTGGLTRRPVRSARRSAYSVSMASFCSITSWRRT